MAAIIRVGTTQVMVEEGDRIKVEKMNVEAGGAVELGEVLAVINGKNAVFGRPLVEGAKVEAKVVSQGRDKKIEVYKYKPKKRYRLHRGHRQDYTELKIEKIIAPGASAES